MSWGVNISCSMDVTYKRTTLVLLMMQDSCSHTARYSLHLCVMPQHRRKSVKMEQPWHQIQWYATVTVDASAQT